MLERSTSILRIVCIALAALLLAQASRLVTRKDPLASLNLSALSAAAARASASARPPAPATGAAKTNSPAGTNAAAAKATGSANAAPVSTNSLAATNTLPSTNLATVSAPAVGTNSLTGTNLAASNVATNVGTNLPPKIAGSTNAPVLTNAVAGPPPGGRPPRGPGGMPPGMPGMPGMPGGGGAKLPPQLQARVERIYQSELLGPVIRPMPMALIGIAGKDVMLRASNGQTGLIREGEELGGVKLLRIGTNRVLVEEGGQKKELTIFSGFGSETLLSKEKEPTK